ncbi:glycine C-acetyltransferase [Mesoterricola sediminis]|uniref:2-amino-3-ketobutyrate coenzyme A ligase n=1 Tax=Mesoterricola sediminis TaxID=2927980 RepID=A0AA48GPU7_9BACT|nr:glycine C-acetyltransferase [Mesoterricola sediminis]BDU77051.1 2-amino-3-ketobutyrate coenzyme A ligase [Mesoterricola sediminis]
MNNAFKTFLIEETAKLKEQGLYKTERIMTSPQGAWVEANGKKVINLCANNYLGLANHPELVKAAQEALGRRGFGLSSVRFICGTQDIHKELEAAISDFLGMEDTQLYSSCFDANGGVFEPLLGEEDAIISDALNHASIIDGVRLCKAQRFRYANSDMADLEAQLKAAAHCRFKLIVTDGVFSMDGYLANLPAICDLAEKHGAMVMVDDSHAVGFVGEKGRGTHEHHGVMGRVDIITGTLGKALGGASGGYVSSSSEVIGWLRQKSRPYLFSNTLAPSITATSLKVLELLKGGDGLRRQLKENALHFRTEMTKLGFKLLPGEHPIIPVMFYDAPLAQQFASRLLDEGVYVTGFFFPVVPKGQARIRTQMSAAHSRADLDVAIAAFAKVGRELGVIQ